MLSHGFEFELAKSVPFIPDILKNCILLKSTPMKNGLDSHIFASKLRMDNKEYVVCFIILEDRNGRMFYDHELTEIIDPDSVQHSRDTSQEALGPVARTNQGDFINILREVMGVKDGSANILFQSASPALPGHTGDLLGPNFSEKIRNEVRELVSILPSHDPMSGFAKNDHYPEKAQAYQDALKARAGNFGIDASGIDGMKKPVLVRTRCQELFASRRMMLRRNLTPGRAITPTMSGRQSSPIMMNGWRNISHGAILNLTAGGICFRSRCGAWTA